MFIIKNRVVMKIVFILHVVLFLAMMILCLSSIVKKRDPLKVYIVKLLTLGIFVVTLYSLTILISDNFWGTLVDGVYFAGLDWLLYMLVSYCLVFDELKQTPTKKNLPRYIAIVLCTLDSISLVVNVFTHHAFTLSPTFTQDGEFQTWHADFYLPYTIHLIFCYVLTADIIAILLVKFFKSLKFYRHKYLTILLSFMIVIVCNALFMSLNWTFDFSILTYGALAVILWYQTFYGVPKEQRNSIISLISQNISSAIICFDNSGKVIYANSTALSLFNADEGETKIFEDYRHSLLKSTLASNVDYFIDEDRFAINGKEHIFSREIRNLKDSENRLIGTYIKFDDHTSDIEHLKKESYRANHDLLTGLYNRHGFIEVARKKLTEEPDIERYFIAVNIKNFKLINDLFGSRKGDEILIAEGRYLNQIARDEIFTARFSSDRFAVLIPKEYFNPQMTEQELLELSSLTSEYNYKMKIFVGVYEISNSHEDITSMYDKACMAFDNLDSNSEDSIVFYNTDLMEELKKEKRLIGEFPSALESNEFCMFLQPQIDTEGTLCGAEALVRWIKKDKGIVPPYEFIPYLEKTGYIHRLDEFIWEEAAKKLSDWKQRGYNDLHISVNISAKDFYYTDIYEKFTSLVDKYNIDPKNLKLEITETVLIHNIELHRQILTKLQQKGFWIEMDDFGSGYSSLNMLKDINVDVIKIDMGFLRKTENEVRSLKILESIFDMAIKLNIHTVCEGVETLNQVENLKNMGCEIYQGYYFSKPIPVSELEEKYFKETDK